MPHLVLEAARNSIERQLLTTPIEFDSAGQPADILAPPVPIQRTVPTGLGVVRVNFIVQSVSLQPIVGAAQSTLALTFDQGSVELLGGGAAASLLAGSVTVPFAVGFVQAAGSGGPIAQMVADFTATNVGFALDAASAQKLTTQIGAAAATLAQTAIGAALTTQFRAMGRQPVGLNLDLRPGQPSEQLLTVDALPSAVWVSSEALAVALEYAPAPPPFPVVPFLPNVPSAFGLRLSNDGFQRTVRNPAVRRIARDMLSARLIDGFVQQVYAERNGQGGPTDQDRAEGQKRLDAYLATPQGLMDIANETPSPVGNGRLRKRITKVPDPFSDFDVEVPELDLWLGQDRIEGRARATGKVNGFGFSATVRFRARPVLVTSPSLSFEMHDLEIDDPDIDIDLPFWLEAAAGLLTTFFAGPVFGVIVGFLLSSIIASLAEAFIPSGLGSAVPMPGPQAITGLPKGTTLTDLSVVPEFLQVIGRWNVSIVDPRPFYPLVRLADTVTSTPVGVALHGTAWFTCLGPLGIVIDSDERSGTPIRYTRQSWRSQVRVKIEPTAVPLPLTHFPWTIALGYRSLAQYHFPVMTTAPQPLVPGNMTFTVDVWNPEPPHTGRLATSTFTLAVQRVDDDTFVIDVPVESLCIILDIRTRVVDAAGTNWDVEAQVDVMNETVALDGSYDGFASECGRQRRVWYSTKVPSLLDKVSGLDRVAKAVQDAIRTEQPAVTNEIAALVESGRRDALNVIIAPSLVKGRQ